LVSRRYYNSLPPHKRLTARPHLRVLHFASPPSFRFHFASSPLKKPCFPPLLRPCPRASICARVKKNFLGGTCPFVFYPARPAWMGFVSRPAPRAVVGFRGAPRGRFSPLRCPQLFFFGPGPFPCWRFRFSFPSFACGNRLTICDPDVAPSWPDLKVLFDAVFDRFVFATRGKKRLHPAVRLGQFFFFRTRLFGEGHGGVSPTPPVPPTIPGFCVVFRSPSPHRLLAPAVPGGPCLSPRSFVSFSVYLPVVFCCYSFLQGCPRLTTDKGHLSLFSRFCFMTPLFHGF